MIGTPTREAHRYTTGDKGMIGKIRKISFSIILNTDYEGGNFEFEVGAPHDERALLP